MCMSPGSTETLIMHAWVILVDMATSLHVTLLRYFVQA